MRGLAAVGLGVCALAATLTGETAARPSSSKLGKTGDILFTQEFPNFKFTKRGDYSIVTDGSPQEADKILRILIPLRAEFEKHFAPLICKYATSHRIEVVYFNTEQAFRDYARKVAPALVNSAGFYSSADNRLLLLNQLGTSQFTTVQNRLEQRQRNLRDPAAKNPGEDRVQASTQLGALRSEMAAEAQAMTERLIRHEGAHQLFDAFRIQSALAAEPTWLSEGLAEYCETSKIGAYHPVMADRIAKARRAGKLLPIKMLLNHRDPAGFFCLGEKQIELAYAQSWALVYFFMHGDYRAGFLDFIRYYRDLPDHHAAAAAIGTDTDIILERFLTTDIRTVESKWEDFLNRL